MKPKVKFETSVSLVTGAGSGIGKATALSLSRRGSRVICVDIDEKSAKEVALQCDQEFASSSALKDPSRSEFTTHYQCDVRDDDQIQELARSVHEDFGALTILVNNAGVGMSGSFLSMTKQDWEWIRSVNLDGVIACTRAFLPAMVERGYGHVVNLSSGLGYTPRATEPAYVTTKAGVLAFSQCLRAEVGHKGVGVSAICPGVINTPILSATRFLGDQATATNRLKVETLFGRGHRPETVANAIISAISANRAVVPVGWESWIGWVIHRLMPVGFQQVLARQNPL